MNTTRVLRSAYESSRRNRTVSFVPYAAQLPARICANSRLRAAPLASSAARMNPTAFANGFTGLVDKPDPLGGRRGSIRLGTSVRCHLRRSPFARSDAISGNAPRPASRYDVTRARIILAFRERRSARSQRSQSFPALRRHRDAFGCRRSHPPTACQSTRWRCAAHHLEYGDSRERSLE